MKRRVLGHDYFTLIFKEVRTMFKKIVGIITISVIGISLYYGAAFSTPSSGQTNTSIVIGIYDKLNVKKSGEARVTVRTKEDVDIVTTTATVAVGGYSGWHSHPGPVFVTVTQGTLTVYTVPDCQPQVYEAGEGFVEPSPKQVHLVRNEGTEEAAWTATFIVPVGAVRRIDEPQPTGSNCPIS
jgi:quercetin dioxygenase-like cupin family protein